MLILEKTIQRNGKTYVVSILTDQYGLLVRKAELLHGISIPTDETYVLNIDQASIFHQKYMKQVQQIQFKE